MTRLRLLATLVITFALCLPTLAFAQVQNGDFENGGAGWVVDPPPPGWTVDFPPAGGNPNGRAAITSPFGNSQGEACIRQGFQCSSPGAGGSCNISFDYRLESIVPGVYPGRTRHFHVNVQAPGRRVLTTQLYFPDEPLNQRDGIFDRDLVMKVRDGDGGKTARFVFIL